MSIDKESLKTALNLSIGKSSLSPISQSQAYTLQADIEEQLYYGATKEEILDEILKHLGSITGIDPQNVS